MLAKMGFTLCSAVATGVGGSRPRVCALTNLKDFASNRADVTWRENCSHMASSSIWGVIATCLPVIRLFITGPSMHMLDISEMLPIKNTPHIKAMTEMNLQT